jgi:hypothetical protein
MSRTLGAICGSVALWLFVNQTFGLLHTTGRFGCIVAA